MNIWFNLQGARKMQDAGFGWPQYFECAPIPIMGLIPQKANQRSRQTKRNFIDLASCDTQNMDMTQAHVDAFATLNCLEFEINHLIVINYVKDQATLAALAA